ncbi:TetR/AcrR family transcriptional regulator [Demequina zhanjiangensis]|uniref:TetR/AcrR family transcriptional regulator n=1 Tax=Demequina zhanjiangensis TaxID=3051659 RepID=A0ABT8G596_9MICO|nr:TetR/AcrR family transcriptional regulator [Demequina sp. SYSU T00b26]MDN4474187.1 TetR/AcrR family transcriptional regulator [Demequina sp. SYSU T00b26]
MTSSETPRKRGPYAKSTQVRAGIIKASASVLEELGYHGMTIAEVARRAGVSHNGLLHHFPDKDALLVAVLQDLDDERRQRLTLTEPDGPLAHPREALLATFNSAALGMGGAMFDLELVLTSEARDPSHPAHAFMEQRLAAIKTFLTRAFAELAEHGELGEGIEPQVAATMSLALLQGLMTQRAYAQNAAELQEAGEQFLRSIGVPAFGDEG